MKMVIKKKVMNNESNDYRKIAERLSSIEVRLSKLEASFSVSATGYSPGITQEASAGSLEYAAEKDDEEKGFESTVGRIGLGWLGSIVLLFAVIFFTEYLLKAGTDYLAYLTGYFMSGLVFLSAYYLRRSTQTIPPILNIVGHLLTFYITLRLHFFSASPFFGLKALVIAFLLIITGIQIFIAILKKRQSNAMLSIIFLLITSLLSGSTHVTLVLVTLSALGSLVYMRMFGWKGIFSVTMLLCYIVFFIWMFNNPVAGRPFRIIQDHDWGILYLFAVAGTYCSLPLFRGEDSFSDNFIISGIIINGLLFTFTLAIVTISFIPGNYVFLYSLISASCLLYAVLLKRISDWNFAPAFFALYGFLAMSIAMYGMAGLPRVYLFLSVQSLGVVAMALWFRNKLMILMNSILFLTIIIIYLLLSENNDGVNFSVALVALISARIINWQKSRLNIQTEHIRNLYLIEGFFMVLYALYHAVPGQFVTISWTGAALLHFLLSFILKNVKYRYMALGTMACSAVYLFFVDLARIELIYRVIALLSLALVSIGISIYYTSRVRRKEGNN